MITHHFLAGCEFIKPIYGFECHLCSVFIRNENDIEDHVSLLQHKKFYQVTIDITMSNSLPFLTHQFQQENLH